LINYEDLTARLAAATDWQSYYEMYREVYRDLVCTQWGLGQPTFAGYIHHIAIPDSSGSIAALNWAAYSQPSNETLVAALALFRDLLSAEPLRRKSNRFLFLTLEPQAISADAIRSTLAGVGALDLWTGSIPTTLALPAAIAAAESVEVFFGAVGQSELGQDLYVEVGGDKWLRAQVMRARETAAAARNSSLPAGFREQLALSSICLAGFRLGISTAELTTMISDSSGVSFLIASVRSGESGWGSEAERYFRQLQVLNPIKTKSYLVRPGDMLSRIVRELYEIPFHSIWPIIKTLNSRLTDPNRIIAGDTILLPDWSPSSSEER
jgi:hypothetical protein